MPSVLRWRAARRTGRPRSWPPLAQVLRAGAGSTARSGRPRPVVSRRSRELPVHRQRGRPAAGRALAAWARSTSSSARQRRAKPGTIRIAAQPSPKTARKASAIRIMPLELPSVPPSGRAQLAQGDAVADRLVFGLEAVDVVREDLEGGVGQGDRALGGRRLRADREDRHAFLGGEDEAVDRAFLEQFAGSFARRAAIRRRSWPVSGLNGPAGGDRRGRDADLLGDLAGAPRGCSGTGRRSWPGSRARRRCPVEPPETRVDLRRVDEDLARGGGDLQGPFVQARGRDADLVGA